MVLKHKIQKSLGTLSINSYEGVNLAYLNIRWFGFKLINCFFCFFLTVSQVQLVILLIWIHLKDAPLWRKWIKDWLNHYFKSYSKFHVPDCLFFKRVVRTPLQCQLVLLLELFIVHQIQKEILHLVWLEEGEPGVDLPVPKWCCTWREPRCGGCCHAIATTGVFSQRRPCTWCRCSCEGNPRIHFLHRLFFLRSRFLL